MRILQKPMAAFKDTSEPRWFDWTFFGIIAGLALYFFSQGDILLTSLHSYDLLSVIKSGKLFSFYEIAYEKALAGGYCSTADVSFAANYNIIIYLVLAIWLLPVKIIGFFFSFTPSALFLDIYCKHLIFITVLASGYILYLLGGKFGLDKTRSKWLSFLFLSSPILLYGSTMFGQLDIFSILLTLISLLFYMDKKYLKFSLIMCAAICFKIFAFFIFIPLLLLAEKRILHLIKYGAVGVSLLLFTRLLAAFDPGYSVTQTEMSNIYNFTGRLFAVTIPSSYEGVAAFAFIMIIVCCIAYFVNPIEENQKYWVVVIPLLSYGAFFTFVNWHPQWVSILYPFIALSIMLMANFKAAALIDSGINLGFILIMLFCWPNDLSLTMINGGILVPLFHHELTLPGIATWLSEKGYAMFVFTNTIFLGCLIPFIGISIYSLFNGKKRSTGDNPSVMERSIVWLRMSLLPIILIIPSFILYIFYR